MTLQEFAIAGVRERLDRLAAEVKRVSEEHGAEAVHDLRVANRRLSQALHALRSVFSKDAVKQIRAELKAMMDLAAEVRNRDIALDLFEAAGVPAESPVCRRLSEERAEAMQRLIDMAVQWHKRRFDAPWRPLLGAPQSPAGEAAP